MIKKCNGLLYNIETILEQKNMRRDTIRKRGIKIGHIGKVVRTYKGLKETIRTHEE